MKKPTLLKSVFIVSFFLLSSGLCLAQTEEEKTEAKKMFKEGVSFFESGKHAQALEAFQQSYKFRPLWAIRFNLGLCYKELGMYTRAKHEFYLFLEEGGSEVKSSMKKQVEQELAQLAGTIAFMEIALDVEDAHISMDGKSIGKSPLERKVEIDPGSHILSVSKKG
ncbi:MAG: tetratricopeptide repeat protein, partial [Pseudomonadota bacterium]